MRLLDSRSTVAAVALLAGLLGACQSHAQEEAFLSTRVPVMRLDSVLQASDSLRLPLAAARTLLAAAADTGFATRAPKDTMTITDILAWARAEAARKRQAETEQSAAERARQDLVRRELDSTLVVTVVRTPSRSATRITSRSPLHIATRGRGPSTRFKAMSRFSTLSVTRSTARILRWTGHCGPVARSASRSASSGTTRCAQPTSACETRRSAG